MKVLSYLTISFLAMQSLALDLPYDLAKAEEHGCLKNTQVEKAISVSDQKLCQEAMENILYELYYSYGVGVRTEEDGCKLESTQMLFTTESATKVTLSTSPTGHLRAHLTCRPEGQSPVLMYVDYLAHMESVTDVSTY